MTSLSGSTIGGCLSICDDTSNELRNNSCSGLNCCQTTIPSSLSTFRTSFGEITNAERAKLCKYAFLVDQDWFTSDSTNISDIGHMDNVPIVLEWNLFNYTTFDIYGMANSTNSTDMDCTGGSCFCSKGFQGNPYLLHGCEGKTSSYNCPKFVYMHKLNFILTSSIR